MTFLKKLEYIIWGGERYDTHKSISRALQSVEVSMGACVCVCVYKAIVSILVCGSQLTIFAYDFAHACSLNRTLTMRSTERPKI